MKDCLEWIFLSVNVIAAPYENYIDITLPNESTKQIRKYNIEKEPCIAILLLLLPSNLQRIFSYWTLLRKRMRLPCLLYRVTRISQLQFQGRHHQSSTGSLSFKDALLHEEMEAMDTCPTGVDEDWIMDPIEDTTDSLDLAIPLPPRVREKIYAQWKNNLIVKVVGKSFGYKALLLCLTGIWRPKGTISTNGGVTHKEHPDLKKIKKKIIFKLN